MRHSCLTLGVWFALAVSAQAAVVVRFQPEASPEAGLVRLGDIAEIVADSPADATWLAGLVLAPRPAEGRRTTLELAEIQTRLRALGVDLATVEFGGSSRVIIHGTALEKPALVRPVAKPAVVAPRANVGEITTRRLHEQVRRAVREYLARQSSGIANCDVVVTLSSGTVAALAAMESGSWEVRGGQAPWTGEQTFTLQGNTDAGPASPLEIVASVTPWPRVLVLRSPLGKGQVLTADDLEPTPMNPETFGGKKYLVDPRQVVGRQTVRATRAGEPLTDELIKETSLVRRGELVSVACRRGGIVVRKEARANEDGALGQTITLVSADGRQRFVARVVAFHETEIVSGDTPTESGVRLVQSPAPAEREVPR
jgi:flagella basal body P-ring formation protein FlgA